MAKQSVNRLSVPRFILRYRSTLVYEGGHTAPCGLLRDSAAAAAALLPCFAGLDREQFLVCCLDAKTAVLPIIQQSPLHQKPSRNACRIKGNNSLTVKYEPSCQTSSIHNSVKPHMYSGRSG